MIDIFLVLNLETHITEFACYICYTEEFSVDNPSDFLSDVAEVTEAHVCVGH